MSAVIPAEVAAPAPAAPEVIDLTAPAPGKRPLPPTSERTKKTKVESILTACQDKVLEVDLPHQETDKEDETDPLPTIEFIINKYDKLRENWVSQEAEEEAESIYNSFQESHQATSEELERKIQSCLDQMTLHRLQLLRRGYDGALSEETYKARNLPSI